MSNEYKFGWVKDEKEVARIQSDLPHPVFKDVWPNIKGSGKGKVVLLYDVIRKVVGFFPQRLQTIGDCVSQGAAYAVDAVKCVDILIKKQSEEWVNETATEPIYWGSRVVIGEGRLGYEDGSVGAWAAAFCNKYGAVPRKKYPKVDLSRYDGERARRWGQPDFRPPKDFVEFLKRHSINVVSQVSTYEEVRDLIANGYAVTVASMQGFTSRRDSEGFAHPRGSWAHQMCILGVDDDYRRPGVLIQNSWGPDWIDGPKRHDQPDGSFWVDAEVLEYRMLSEGDSWAYSGYEGFKPRDISTYII